MRVGLFAIPLALLPGAAHAHMLSTGVGPFYDGFTHLFVTPADILVVIALALVAGLGGTSRARLVLIAALAAWALGIPAGAILFDAEWRSPILFNGLVVATGLFAALDRKLFDGIFATAAFVVGTILGCSAGSGLRSIPYAFETGLGMFAGVAVATSLLVAAALSRPANWQRIAMRVLGSWIAAIGLLTLAAEFAQRD